MSLRDLTRLGTGIGLLLAIATACAALPEETTETAQEATSLTDDIAARQAAMGKLSFLIGDWVGQASSIQPDGSVIVARSEDDIAFLQEGTILMISGRGYAPGAPEDAAPSSENLGLIIYDETTGTFGFWAFRDGRMLTGDVLNVDEGDLSWSLPAVGIRISIRVGGPNRLVEQIERTPDGGQTWVPAKEIVFTRRDIP